MEIQHRIPTMQYAKYSQIVFLVFAIRAAQRQSMLQELRSGSHTRAPSFADENTCWQWFCQCDLSACIHYSQECLTVKATVLEVQVAVLKHQKLHSTHVTW